ncbi:phosphatidylglycerophosphatase A [Sneathiella sp.]|jgi:phosphatidylglycerophosphatase A|uniref:phosphatidylglycerophosphatase A family protein n=1 Tax=Sneathiella sp. TaxID=1964365 RepID=UPI0039E31A56
MTSLKNISLFHPATILATWFWTGLSPKAPGTIGSLAALPFGYLIFSLLGDQALLIAIGLVFVIGVISTDVYLKKTGASDPGEVVIDEVAGQWIPLLIAGTNPLYYLFAFVLFRIFDILKPWPIGWMDKHIKGAFGVMFDDIAAGICAALILFVITQVL